MAERSGRWGFLALDLAIVLGMLGALAYHIASDTARLEAQNAADAAALAGAATLAGTLGDSLRAVREAKEIALSNSINGQPARIVEGDVMADPYEGRVEVAVTGRALPFTLPILRPSVRADAAAEARVADPRYPDRPMKVLQLVE